MMRPILVLPWSLFCLAVLVLSACSGGSSGGSGDDGTPSQSYIVTATAGQGGSISPSTQTVIQGSSATFNLLPDEGYSIASVSGCEGTLNGNVYSTGPISSSCKVTASFAPMSYSITATAGAGGSISPGTKMVTYGDSVTFSVIPDSGYSIESIIGCNGTLTGNVFTTGPISGSCTVTVSFALMSYSVTATAGTGGSISPDTKMVSYGDTVTFSVTPDSGYSIESIIGCNGTLNGTTYTSGLITSICTVTANFTTSSSSDTFNISTSASPFNGGNVTGGGAYSAGMSVTVSAEAAVGHNFVNWTEGGLPITSSSDYTFTVDTARTLVANFELKSYSVNAIATDGGTIEPANSSVAYESNTSFTVSPNFGYSIESVSGCYGSLEGSTYTTGTITESCSVTATFVQNSYVVTATSGSGGSITPSSQTVAEGDTFSFTLTPETGYIIQEISGCNGTLNGYIYTTGVVSGDCNVTASYVLSPVLKFDEGSFDKNTLG